MFLSKNMLKNCHILRTEDPRKLKFGEVSLSASPFFFLFEKTKQNTFRSGCPFKIFR